METYKVFRSYRDDPHHKPIIKTGLTLAQAQAHCSDPETASGTSNDETAADATGPWFDGYTEE